VVICTLGDLLLDVVVRLGAPLARGGDAPATTRLSAGGQAANVAAWVAHLGGQARFIGVRSSDAVGTLVANDLGARGVELLGPTFERGTGTVVALVDDTFERTMATDRGIATELGRADIDPAWFAGCDRLHLSGYSLMRAPIDTAALRASREARQVGARVSVDLSSWSAIRDFGPATFRDRLTVIAPDVVFANEQELDVLGDEPNCRVLVTKRGAEGCTVRWPGGEVRLPALPADVVDTTGAGDAFAAGFLLGDSAADAARRGLAAAAACVAHVGAMPDTMIPSPS
jgi:sugar/nucleoside kinase (ribokinase family)